MPFIPLDQPDQQPRRGFVPLSDAEPKRGFVPLQAEDEQPSILKTVALENPLTAIGETGLNLASQAVALPVAGLAGIGAATGNVLGLTERTGAETVNDVAEALTYQPRGELGKATTDLVTKPFQWLAEAGQHAGGKTLEATDSPLAATAVDTAVNSLPMLISPVKKGVTSLRERIAANKEATAESARGFVPLEDAATTRDATNALPGIREAARAAEITPETMGVRGFNPLKEVPEESVRNFADLETNLGGRRIEPESPVQSGMRGVDDFANTAHQSEALPMEQVWRGGERGSPAVAEQFGRLPDEFRTGTQPGAMALAEGHRQEFRAGEHRLEAVAGLGRPEETIAPRNVTGGYGDALGRRETAREASGAPATLDPNAGPLSRVVNTGIRTGATTLEPAAAVAPRAQSMASIGSKTESGTEYSFAPGKSYAGFIDDSMGSGSSATPNSVTGRAAPMRREDIIVPFANELGASIYTGRVKMKNALGFFRSGNEEVRIKKHADLETTAHELAHLIDSRLPGISAMWKSNKPLAEQLKAVSYDHTSVKEGFAEAVRLWMTQPDVLLQRAPLAAEWLDKFAASDSRYGKAMRKAQDGMTRWFAQDAVDRARSKIGDHAPLSDAMNGIFDRFRQSVSDDLHGIYRMERELQGGKLEQVGAYESARLSRASASIADGAVRFGYPVKQADGAFTYRGKGLQDILKPLGENLDDALLYFVGRSAGELMQQGREHLFTKGEIRGMQALETPEARKAFAEYQAWNRGVLDFAEANGVLNPETRKLWKRTEYLPFHRVQQPGGIKGKPGDWAGIQQLTGGTENIKDVLGNMIGNAAQLIDVAVKNEARQKLATLASRPGGGRFMAKIDTGSKPVKIGGDQVLNAMFEKYGIAIDGDAPAFFQFMTHGQPPAGGNVVAVLKGGKPVWYEVADPILYRSLRAIDRPPMDWLVRWLGFPKRVGQLTITLTPDFMMANIARDTIMGAVMSRSGFRPVIDSLQGMRLRLTEDPLYKDYIANGGGLSSIYLDEAKVRAKLEKFYTRQGIDYRTVLDTPDKLLSAIETIADAVETSTRLGEYRRAIDAGNHPRHAAYLGREVSTDFAMRGDSKALGFLYDTVMFLRPAVVSMDRLYRGIAHDSNKAAIGAKTAMLALASVGLYMLNRDDSRYQDLNEWDRDANWHFFVGDQHFRYPKIWEIGAVASVAERTTEKLLQEDPQGLGKDFARIVGHTFNLNFMPQIVAPLYELATNRNGFTKAPIETPGMENVQPFLRAKPNTSETMKALGMASRDLPEALQVPPARAEALLRGYLNTWGMYGLMLSDRAFFGDKLPETRTDQLPVARRFYSQEPPQHTKFETQFYDMLGEAKRLQGTLHALDAMGRPDIADQIESSPLAGESKPLERTSRNVMAIAKDMHLVRQDATLTPAEKRQRLDELTVERNALMKSAVLDAKKAQADKR